MKKDGPAESSDIPSRRRGRSIQGRLVLLLLFVFIPLLVIEAYMFYERFKAERDDELQANLEVARSVAKTFESFVQDVLHQELAIGLAITSSQPMTSEDIARLLKTHQDYAAVREFSWVSPEGVFLYSSNPSLIGANNSDRTYFSDIAHGREWTVGELILSRATGEPVFTISRGIRDDKGALLGVVVGAVIPEKLDALLSLERGKGGSVTLIDNKGMLVYRHPAIKVSWEERNWLKDRPDMQQVLEGKEITTTVYAPYEGKKRLIGNTPVGSIGWIAGAGQREEELIAPILAGIGKSAVLILSVSIGAFVFALFFSRRIAGSVIALRAHALALGRGEQGERVRINQVSEFQDLAEAFNTMAEKVRSREMELIEQREWLRVTLTSIGDAVIATDLEGRITFINPVASEFTGWLEEEARGRSVQEVFRLVNEQTQSHAEDIVGRVLSEGRVVAMANHTALVSRDGREIPIEDSAAPIRDAIGNMSGVVVVFHDVTEKRRVQEALRRAHDELEIRVQVRTEELNEAMDTLRAERQRFHDVLDALPVYVCLLTPDYHVPFANEVFRQRFGVSQGLRCFEHLFGRSEPCEVCDTYKVLKTMEPHQWEWIGPDSRNYNVFDFPFTDSDGSTLILEMGIDITERKQAEAEVDKYHHRLEELVKERTGQLEAANARLQVEIGERGQVEKELRRAHDELEERVRERTAELRVSNRALTGYAAKLERLNEELQEFAFVASHDLQEPLRKIQTFGHMLTAKFENSLGAEGQDYLMRVTRAAKRMSELLQSLLDYSRITSRPSPFEPLELARIAQDAVSDLELTIKEVGGIVEIGHMPVIDADAVQVRRLFHNLIGNSIRYSKECEKPAIKVHGITSGGMCKIFVEDNGIGFDEQYVDRIFRPFQQLHGKSAGYGGTGMGLAICRKIVERHGGSITARSALGQGSTFIINLPVKQTDPKET
jgi:PAS domain S-box-containing protein